MCLSDKLAIIDSVPGDKKRYFFYIFQPPMVDVFVRLLQKKLLHKKLQIYYIKKRLTMKEFIPPKFQNIICESCTINCEKQKNVDLKIERF